MQEKVILVCTVCLSRNYRTMKNKLSNMERLTLNKFCASCNKHTIHKETR